MDRKFQAPAIGLANSRCTSEANEDRGRTTKVALLRVEVVHDMSSDKALEVHVSFTIAMFSLKRVPETTINFLCI